MADYYVAKYNMSTGMRSKQLFIAMLLTFLTVPLLLDLSAQVNIAQIASGLRVYSNDDFKNVIAPISVSVLNVKLENRLYNVPMLITPSNNVTLGAIALIGVQKELLYNERSEFCFRSPYIRKSLLFTEAHNRSESVWKYQGTMYNRSLTIKGRVIKLQQEYRSKAFSYGPESPYLRVAGMTDAFEVFLLSPHLEQIWVCHSIADALADDMERFGVLNFTKFAISMDEDRVYISAHGITSEVRVFVFTAALRVIDGAVDWINRGVTDPSSFRTREDALLSSARISIEEHEANDNIADLEFLRRYCATNPHRQHGESTFIEFVEEIVVFRTENLIFSLEKTTGIEVASFVFPRNTLLTTNSRSELMLYAVADDALLVERLDGEHFRDVTSALVYEAALHFGKSAERSRDYEMRDVLFAQYKGELFTFVATATDSGIYVLYNNKLTWMRHIADIQQISLHKIQPNLIVLIATTRITSYILNPTNGQIFAEFPFKSERPDFLADENQLRIAAGITVARIHAFTDEKSILVQRGPLVDVLSVRNGARFNFLVEIGAALLCLVVAYGVAGTVATFRQRKRE